MGILLDRQQLMANIALNIGGRLQLDASGFNGAPDATADNQLFRKEVAVDARAFAYVNARTAHLALNTAEDIHCPIANNFSDNGRTRTYGGDPPCWLDIRRLLLDGGFW